MVSSFTNARSSALTFVLFAPLAACGGSDFTGTWTGDVVRTDQTTQQQVTASESWEVDDHAATLVRTRGADRCELELDPGCPDGCFTQTIEPGQTCTVEGQALVVIKGTLDDNSVGTPQKGKVTVRWGATVDGPALFIDEGELTQRED